MASHTLKTRPAQLPMIGWRNGTGTEYMSMLDTCDGSRGARRAENRPGKTRGGAARCERTQTVRTPSPARDGGAEGDTRTE